MPDLMRNILMQLLKSLFKRELERQSADHFQQCLMAITTSKIENEYDWKPTNVQQSSFKKIHGRLHQSSVCC